MQPVWDQFKRRHRPRTSSTRRWRRKARAEGPAGAAPRPCRALLRLGPSGGGLHRLPLAAMTLLTFVAGGAALRLQYRARLGAQPPRPSFAWLVLIGISSACRCMHIVMASSSCSRVGVPRADFGVARGRCALATARSCCSAAVHRPADDARHRARKTCRRRHGCRGHHADRRRAVGLIVLIGLARSRRRAPLGSGEQTRTAAPGPRRGSAPPCPMTAAMSAITFLFVSLFVLLLMGVPIAIALGLRQHR